MHTCRPMIRHAVKIVLMMHGKHPSPVHRVDWPNSCLLRDGARFGLIHRCGRHASHLQAGR